MWNWFNCYLSGRHDYVVSCKQGAIFLRCPHCGRRSSGWSLHARAAEFSPHPQTAPVLPRKVIALRPPPRSGRVLPFSRAIS